MTRPIRLMTVAPGHFHAALVQKRMHPGVARRGYVYAPLDADLVAHLDRLAAFNTRPDDPTAWEIEVRAGGDYLNRFLREQPGNTVVLSGRNRPKIDVMLAAVENGLHVLADKPWVVEAADLPKLDRLLAAADAREVLVWDVLTERHEVTNRLMRELVRARDVFGNWLVGTAARPALDLESVHHLKKAVAGRPLRRPWWWFDPAVSGEAMADVGTHLADLALGFVAPDQPVEFASDVRMLDAARWPLVLAPEQFAAVTGLADYPAELLPRVVEGQLYYAGNTTVSLTVYGVHVRLTARWEYESAGGDTHAATARGTRATVTIGQESDGPPELGVTPTDAADGPKLLADLLRTCDDWQGVFPGVGVEDRAGRFAVTIPAALRVGHEAHFGAVVAEFVRYFQCPRAVPPWERTNAATRYAITTTAVEMARKAKC